MKRTKRKRTEGAAPEPSLAWVIAVPAVTAAILSLPRLWLGYFWDDFIFLTGGGHGGPSHFLSPDPSAAFYRPISQGLYFMFLQAVDPSSGFVGHLLNMVLVALAVALVAFLVSDLSGRRAGLMAGLLVACYGHFPSLVTWISCSQDLLAIVFVAAAFWLRNRGRDLEAVICATAAVLCKEPAIAAIPILACWDWLTGRPIKRSVVWVAGYAAIVALWVAIHPGIRTLASRGFQSGATGYVGIENPARWVEYLFRYAMTLANLPPLGFTVAWPDELSIVATLAIAALLAGILLMPVSKKQRLGPDAVAPRRVAAVGLLFTVPTLLLPTILVRHWAPYFACIPAVGLAIAAGPWLGRLPTAGAVSILSVFLLLGIWSRGGEAKQEPVWSEKVFVEAAQAARRVERNFKAVFPEFPKGSQVVAATASTGARGINGTLIDNQAIQVWYRDPTLRTVTTLNREPGAQAEFLVRITTDLTVIAIDPESGAVRASDGSQPDWVEIGRPLRNYAREVAADGDTDRGIRVLDALSGIEPAEARPYNRRLVAMMLIAGGRTGPADSLLAITPEFPHPDALGLVRRLLAEASSSEDLDLAAFKAFGLSADDPETLRWMMREFRKEGSLAQAAWWAGRVRRVSAADPEAAAVVQEAAKGGVSPRRVAT